MNNRLFGFLVLPLFLAGLMGLSAVDTACTPAPRKASHGGIMVEWEDAQLLAPGGYARVHRLNDGSYMAVYSRGGNGCFKISNDGCRTWSSARTAMTYNRDCREMLKIVFYFPNELIDKVIEIS